MKHILIAIAAMMLCFSASAKTFEVKDSIKDPVLNELRIIRGIHEDSRNKRQLAIRERMKRDSMKNINTGENLTTDYGIMSQIEENTHQWPLSDGWNLYGAVAIIISIISAWLSWYTFRSQSKTEGNTKKLSQNMQRQLLNDLLRHLYRNYVITYTMRTKMEDIDYKGYPSEEHYDKLKIPMENIHLDAFYGEDDKFRLMHVLYLNLRNFNSEVEVALKHVKDPEISRETKDEDFDTLEFKMSYLTGKIIDTIYDIWGENEKIDEDMRKALKLSLSGATNASGNIDVEGSERFTPVTEETLKETAYAKLYSDKEIADICKTFNSNVHEERKKNKRGAWKVRIIRF